MFFRDSLGDVWVKDKVRKRKIRREAEETLISLSRLSLDWRCEKSSHASSAPEPQLRAPAAAISITLAFMLGIRNREVALTIVFDLTEGRWRRNQAASW